MSTEDTSLEVLVQACVECNALPPGFRLEVDDQYLTLRSEEHEVEVDIDLCTIACLETATSTVGDLAELVLEVGRISKLYYPGTAPAAEPQEPETKGLAVVDRWQFDGEALSGLKRDLKAEGYRTLVMDRKPSAPHIAPITFHEDEK